MSDTQHLFGKILDGGQGERDAVHVAVMPVTAAVLLGPGDHIGLDSDGQATDKVRALGIVDPYLTVNVQPGQRFFMFLYPNSITGLKHRWTHASIPEDVMVVDPTGVPVNTLAMSVSREQAESELRRVCDRWEGPPYDDLIAALQSGESIHYEYGDTYGFNIGDEYIVMYGSDAHGSIPDHRRFWDLAEIVVGRRLDDRPQYFSCSC